MRRAAFTLIEVLMTIALIAIAGTIVLVNLDGMLPHEQKDSPYVVLRKAVDAAWYGAATGHGQISLHFDNEARALVVRPIAGRARLSPNTDPLRDEDGADTGTNTDGSQIFAFNDERVGEVRFMPAPDSGGGSLQTAFNGPFPRLVFSPWGGVTPSIVELDVDGDTYRYRMDIFGGGLEELPQ